MSMPRAPTAMRRPISFVRSVTLTYMMFMIPMPPTTSEIPAMAASSMVIIPVTVSIVSMISCMEFIVKLFSSPSFRRWLRRSTSSISFMAKSVASSVTALHCMPCRWLCESIRFITVVNGASTISSWSIPMLLVPLLSSTPTTWKGIWFTRMLLPMGSSLGKRLSTMVLPITTTLAAVFTSCSENISPSCIFSWRICR